MDRLLAARALPSPRTHWGNRRPLRRRASGRSYFYVHTDHLNAPRKVAQPTTGTLAWRWDADPFGTAAPNQNPGGLGTFVYNLRAPGQYYQAETGLNQNWFRDYDPLGGGRYIESDLIGLRSGVNTYGYASGNPVSRRDPLGLLDNPAEVWPLIHPTPPSPVLPLPYDPSYGPSAANCAQYPPGLLHDICTGTPNNPSMNCSRKCVAVAYPGQWGGPPQDYVFYIIPEHPICWWECKLTPGDFCPKSSK